MRRGDWYVYCDICGQRKYASETTKLSTYTGRGGLVVCNHDVDKIDYGLVPYRPHVERNPSWTRINHTDTEDGAPLVNPETQSLIYYLASSQDNILLVCSQDDAWITIEEPIW